MKWQNKTFRQHFIPQVEQRFNAINPQAATKNQRIYRFEIVNREAFELRLLNPKGQLISNALAYHDLFTFEIDKDTNIRSNFEDAFNRYESTVKTHTESLIQKLATGQQNVNDEIVNLYAAKLLTHRIEGQFPQVRRTTEGTSPTHEQRGHRSNLHHVHEAI